MRWQNWAAVLGASLLLHVVIFWPLPDMQLNGFSRPVLLARIVPVEVPSAREDPPVLEDTRAHPSLQRDDAGVVQMDKRGGGSLRAAGRGAFAANGYQGETPAAFFSRLTEKRWAMLHALQGAGDLAVRELARRLAAFTQRLPKPVPQVLFTVHFKVELFQLRLLVLKDYC